MKIRALTLSAFAFLAAAAFFATRTHAEPDQVKLICPGVWFREGDIESQGHCNNIIIEMKDYLIVVDANYPSGARLALQAAKRISDKPVKYVFDTHHHGDHLYGNAVWTQAGAITLAHIGVADELRRYEPARWQSASKSRPDVAELRADAPEPPKQTFDKSPFVLKDSTREVRFYSFGWAHTRGDGFVYLPKEKVLCTGDAVVNGPYNNTADANIGNWPSVLRNAQRLDATYVLPGHGEPGGKELVEGQIQFMVALHKAVDSQVKQGKKLENLVSGTTSPDGKLSPNATTVTLPDNVKNWVGKPLAGQVRDAYEEISQKKPHGDLPH
jgi:glyoxylase-like metal-dependent hydrolase (beta-lactamase superfamily II)